MSIARNKVATEDQWNIESLFPDLDTWKSALGAISGQAEEPYWPEVEKFRGTLGNAASTLKNVFDQTLAIDRQIDKLFTYAHLKHDEDTKDDTHKQAYNLALALFFRWNQATSWIEPEILTLDEQTLEKYLKAPELAEYRFHLEKTVRTKPHTLPPEQERLMAMAGEALQTASKAFRAINDADFRFGEVVDGKGEKYEITHGSYQLALRSPDRTLRKNAFEQMHKVYGSYENTLCELLGGQIRSHIFNARARSYSSCLEATLFPKNIDTAVYRALIQGIREKGLPALHKYSEVRKQRLGVDELHLYDMYVPLLADLDRKLPYQETENLVIESVAPLGEEYQSILKEGLTTQRWVDRYENENKRSGAYSSGCYDSNPFILMNYKGTMRDLFTLAHEAGHSMHSYYSRATQPYHYASYPIFVAEVASTFNEELLNRLLLQKAKTQNEKLYLISQRLEDIRATLFRQTMFAEFELTVHELAEQGVPLTPTLLRDKYLELNHDYFGDAVVIDDSIAFEWSRIPHFYFNFYVYQYATGLAAAMALSDRVVQGGQKEQDDYLKFLSGGCSKYPIDLLRDAGVDMRSPMPVEAAVNKFSALVDELASQGSALPAGGV